MCMQGRVHYYEGYEMSDVVLPTRLMKMMGAEDGHCLRDQAMGFCFEAGADEDTHFQIGRASCRERVLRLV